MNIIRPSVPVAQMTKLDLIKMLREYTKTVLPSVEVNGTTHYVGMPTLTELKAWVEGYTDI